MSKRTAHFPHDFDFSKLANLEVTTGIRFSDEGSELQERNEAETAQPSPLISTDGSLVLDGDVSPLLQFIKIAPKIIENIAIKLDPQSFLNLACSSSEFYTFFSHPTAREHIDIPLKEEKLKLQIDWRNMRLVRTYRSELVPVPMAVGGLDFRKCVGMIRKWPFSVHVDKLSFEENCEATIHQATEVLHRLGAVSIQMLKSSCGLTYDDLMRFIDRFGVKALNLGQVTSAYTEDEWSALIQKPLDALFVDDFPLELLRLTSIPTICVNHGYRGDMTKAILQSIVQKWLVADDLVRWELGSLMSVDEVIASFSLFSSLPQDFTGPMPVLRPLFYRTGQGIDEEDDGLEVFIMREDGRLLKITDCRDMQEIRLRFSHLVGGRPVPSRQ